jgi:hypothetical protein
MENDMICQAIVTTFFGPTNTKGSRIKAQCNAKTMWFSWDHALGVGANHHRAAAALAVDLGWIEQDTKLQGGSLPGGSLRKGIAWVIL